VTNLRTLNRSIADDFDVIVVGGGGSGLAAAASAAQHGGRVLLLEKQSHLGGTTGIAVGSFTAAGTRWQRARNITDTSDDHADDAGKFASPEIEARNNSELRAFFLAHAAETLDWLESLGVEFIGPSPEPPNRAARMHNAVPNAKAYIAALQLELSRRGGTILTSAAVTDLLYENGRVVGVRVGGNSQPTPRAYRAQRGVILAAGDYASAPDLIRRFKGERFDAIEGINPLAGGDGQRLVEAAGGQLVNMDVTYGPELRFVSPTRPGFQAWLPAGRWSAHCIAAVARFAPRWVMRAYIKRLLVTWQHPENSLFDDGAILVNSRGERFCNERQWPARELTVARQPGKIGYLLLDGRLIERYSHWPHFISTAPDIAYAYAADYLRLRADVSYRAKSLEELAARRSLDGGALQSTVAAFNDYVAGKSADGFGRTGDQHSLQPGDWLLLGPVKAYFTTTEGGAAINQSFAVLDPAGRAIAGLYAVGQNGLGGMILFGHGLHIAWAMTSGRLAGKAMMQSRSTLVEEPTRYVN
jgi:succinate dehydrogenase/fumarate reductase flavoprotein subunit